MGLLLGASLLFLLEIFEFLVNCVIFLTKKCWNRIANTTNVSKVKDAGIAFENWSTVFGILKLSKLSKKNPQSLCLPLYFKLIDIIYPIVLEEEKDIVLLLLLVVVVVVVNVFLHHLAQNNTCIHCIINYIFSLYQKFNLRLCVGITSRKKTL